MSEVGRRAPATRYPRRALRHQEKKPWWETVGALYGVVVAALGLLLYAMVGRAYDTFYGSFGLAPEEVGVTRAAVGCATASQ